MIRDDTARRSALQGSGEVAPASVAASRVWAMLAAVGQILSTLDDRDPLRALRALEPEREQDEERRCTRCATRGE